MRTIWKYRLEVTDVQTIEMPMSSTILKAGHQDGMITLWALVNTNFADKGRKIRIAGTGHPVEEPWAKHIDTVFMGQFVWHIFDLGFSATQ